MPLKSAISSATGATFRAGLHFGMMEERAIAGPVALNFNRNSTQVFSIAQFK